MKFKELSTAQKNFITALLLFTVIVITMYFVIVNIMTYSIKEQIEKKNISILSATQQRISFMFQSIINDMRLIAITNKLYGSSDNYEKEIQLIIERQSLYLSIFSFNKNDKITSQYPPINIDIDSIFPKILEKLKWKKSYVITDLLQIGDTNTIAFAYPLLDNKNNYYGAIIAFLNLSELSNYLGDYSTNSPSFVALLDQKNQITASNISKRIGISIDLHPVGKMLRLQRLGIISENIFDKQMLIAYMPIYIGSYGIMMGEDLDTVTTAIDKPISYIRMGLFIILCTGAVFAFLQAKIIINPINKLITQIKSLKHSKTNNKIFSKSSVTEFELLSSTLNDLTEELIQKEKQVSHILEAMPYAIISIDDKANIITFNKEAALLLNISAKNTIGKSVIELLKPLENKIIDTITHGTIYEDYECIIYDKKGISHNIKYYSSTYKDTNGTHLGTIIVLRDIEYIKQLETILKRNEQLSSIGQMVAGISHELKNPISIIHAAAEAILFEHKNDTESLEYTFSQDILNTVDRMNETIINFLKLVMEQKDIVLKRINLAIVLIDLLRLLKKEMQNKNIEIKVFLGAKSAFVLGDAASLTQVFLNVILNAVQAVKKNGTINILLCNTKEEYTITIADNGPGIPTEKLEYIFSPFYSTKSDGTGLGLSISNEIIVKHHGRIWATSELGQGSNFFIAIPKIETVQKIINDGVLYEQDTIS